MNNVDNDLIAVDVDTTEVARRLMHDREFFIHFFMGSELSCSVPDFHKTVFDFMAGADVPRFVCALPRGHAKTTIAKLTIIWYFLYTDTTFILYISNTAPVACSAVSDIMLLLDCENFKKIFGEIKIVNQNAGIGYYRFRIGKKTCIIRALGLGQQIRGLNIEHTRPQLAICDDIEDEENTESEAGFKKHKRWFYGPFMKCMSPFRNKIIQIGNLIAQKCLLSEHIDSPYWHSMVYGALLSNGRPLWPDMWPIEKLTHDFYEYLRAGMISTWYAEMMNMPYAIGHGLIDPDDIYYRNELHPADVEYSCITIDLAWSDKKWANKTAIAVHGFYDQVWQLVDYVEDVAMKPEDIFSWVLRFAIRWKVNIVGIETAALQGALLPVFNVFSRQKGVKNLHFVELTTQNKRKTHRIAAWCLAIRQKEYALTKGDFKVTNQLIRYDPAKENNEDDLIDSCAYWLQMVEMYMSLILKQDEIYLEHSTLTMYDVCPV